MIDYYDKKAILKQRFRKTYRHAALDQKLLTRRITQVSQECFLILIIWLVLSLISACDPPRKLDAWLEPTNPASIAR